MLRENRCFFLFIFRLRLNSVLATYGITSDKKKSSNQIKGPKDQETYPPLRHRHEREPPRSIKLKPQEYFLFSIAFIAVSILIFYNVFMSYYTYYLSNDEY